MTEQTKAAPQGVVACLVSEGRTIASATAFERGSPAGFSRRQYQEMTAKRALALEAVRALASPLLAEACDAYTAERLLQQMCERGAIVVVVPVGYTDGEG